MATVHRPVRSMPGRQHARGPGAHSVEIVEWVDRLLDALELNAVVLLGHSGGGVWAFRYALAHPARVKRLVLIGPPTLPKTRCPLPYRLIATPGLGEMLRRLAPPSRKSVLQFASFMGEGGRSPSIRT